MKIVSRKVVALSCLSVLASYTGAVSLTGQVQAQPGRVKSTSMDKIPCVRWYDEKADNKAVLFCIHGLGLHKGTYEEFGQEMARRGLITYAIDVRGFGTWTQKQKEPQLDLDGALADIKRALVDIRRMHPNMPIILLGESMGGAIAIHSASQNPELVDGIISSVPAGDRFSNVDGGLKLGFHALFGGFDKPVDIGPMIVGKATQKDDLRTKWLSDPLCRTRLSPNELLTFKSFMDKNFDCAGQVKTCPVLFIQGCKDKLVRPAGTWKLFDSLSTPNKELVMSTSAEHLIFEEGQFSQGDLAFVTKWVDKSVLHIASEADIAQNNKDADAAKKSEEDKAREKQELEKLASAAPIVHAKKPQVTEKSIPTLEAQSQAISYWIELFRNGKVYRCNNKLAFKSGDAIRFHVIPQTDGYAYILMRQGSSGKKAILFPSKDTGTNNFLNAGVDYPLPYTDWLTFDSNPGVEKVSLMFSKHKVANESELTDKAQLTAFISDDMSGAKDLVPTRMQLSWDDPTPVILPDQLSANEKLAQNKPATTSNGSLVKVTFNDPSGMLAVDVALAHQ